MPWTPQNIFCIWACQLYSFHSPPTLYPHSIPHLEPVEGEGGWQRKTQKPEVCLEFIPLNISHSWTNNVLISQQQENHVLHNSKTHTRNKNRLKTTAQIKIFKEAIQWRHEAFLSTNRLTWTLSVTKLILCTLPSFLWGKQSQNGHFSDSTFQKTQTFQFCN